MTSAIAIARKELRGHFNSAAGYVFLTAFLLLTSWFFFRSFFLAGQATLRPFFSMMPWVFLLFVPAAAMRSWAEERKLGTDEVLLTLPVRDGEAVLGKFLGGLGFLCVAIALTAPVPAVLLALGDPDPGPLVGGYAGLVLLGAAYLAISLFASSLTESQVVAFVVGASMSFALFIVGEDVVLVAAPRWLAPGLRYLGLGQHFASISRGVLDTRDLVYYAVVVGFFLYANLKAVEARKWR